MSDADRNRADTFAQELATTKLALAAREAEVVALRGALAWAVEDDDPAECPYCRGMPGIGLPGPGVGKCAAHAALAAPTSTEALREFGLAVVRRTHTAARHMPDAAIVDAVLAGKP